MVAVQIHIWSIKLQQMDFFALQVSARWITGYNTVWEPIGITIPTVKFRTCEIPLFLIWMSFVVAWGIPMECGCI